MDTLSPDDRSKLMRRIKGANTVPELQVRSLCRELGLMGYRIHKKVLPGSPDLSWGSRKIAIFVNGCFWHGHRCSKNRKLPDNNKAFWIAKFKSNRKRDASKIKALRTMGWRVCIVWECEMKNVSALKAKIIRVMQNHENVVIPIKNIECSS